MRIYNKSIFKRAHATKDGMHGAGPMRLSKEYGTVPDFSKIEEKRHSRLGTNVAFSRSPMFCQHLVRKLSLSVSAIV